MQSSDVPENLWVKCPSCSQMLFHKDYQEAFNCCSTCGHHTPLAPEERFRLLFDANSYETLEVTISSDDPLKFKDNKRYPDQAEGHPWQNRQPGCYRCCQGRIGGKRVVIAAFDFRFMGGSMGRTVGDGLLLAADTAVSEKAALIVVPSSGGARMQEGILSLMQLPRTYSGNRKTA